MKYVVHWRSPYGPHCVYAQEWLPKEGFIFLKSLEFWCQHQIVSTASGALVVGGVRDICSSIDG